MEKTIVCIEVRLKRNDLVFLKIEEHLALEHPKLLSPILFYFPDQEMRTDCLNLCGMSLYFFQ